MTGPDRATAETVHTNPEGNFDSPGQGHDRGRPGQLRRLVLEVKAVSHTQMNGPSQKNANQLNNPPLVWHRGARLRRRLLATQLWTAVRRTPTFCLGIEREPMVVRDSQTHLQPSRAIMKTPTEHGDPLSLRISLLRRSSFASTHCGSKRQPALPSRTDKKN